MHDYKKWAPLVSCLTAKQVIDATPNESKRWLYRACLEHVEAVPLKAPSKRLKAVNCNDKLQMKIVIMRPGNNNRAAIHATSKGSHAAIIGKLTK